MPSISARAGSLSVAGSPFAFTDAAAGRVSSTLFKLNAVTLRLLDPSVIPTVEVSPNGDSSDAAFQPAQAVVDPLFGTVKLLNNPGPSALVRVSGSALQVFALALVRSISLSIANDVVELQVFGDGYKRRAVTLRDFSGELSGLSLTASDLDGGTGVVSLDALVASGSPLLIEAGKGSGPDVFRAWVKVPELSHKVTPGALYEHTVKFVGHAFRAADGEFVAWGYGSP